LVKPVVEILDTTLRDGAQMEGISFSVNDKFQILENLVSIGVRYIEAGNPGSNPKDREFFTKFNENRPAMDQTELVAFGPTKRKDIRPEEDTGLADLLSAQTSTIVIFGKTWELEVRDILRCTLEENMALIRETTAYLHAQGRDVIFRRRAFFRSLPG